MIRSPIPKALFIISKRKVEALLMGGQACIIYGAAEFSRDIDLAIHVSPDNFMRLNSAFRDLEAKRVFVPELSEKTLQRGHACHYRCMKEGFFSLRIDVMAVMRGVDPFPQLWERREELELSGVGTVAVMGLPDLVKAKKTQRDKDWPMIRRLLESDISKHWDNPSQEKLRFWFKECRTPEYLQELAIKFPEATEALKSSRPILNFALKGDRPGLERGLREEEDSERELDRQYWLPLKAELAEWRRKGN